MLRVVGPGDGDSIVVAETVDGEQFQLPVDAELRAAITPQAEAEAPVSVVPPRPDVQLSPRDIQVRVRSGESPEDLAADSGTSIERVMRFAFPVLEERARVGDEARRARARRDGDGALVPFGETVDRRFAAHGIDPLSVSWDSFRRPDGSWVVIASWTAGETERHAHWAFSLTARTVLPADEIGSDLLSERPLRPVVRAVPDPVEDPEADARRRAQEELFDQEATESRTYTPVPSDDEPPLPLRLADPIRPPQHAVPAEPREPTLSDDLFGHSEPAAEAEPPAVHRGSGRSKAAREQTKIPSWDDILLGVRRKQD